MTQPSFQLARCLASACATTVMVVAALPASAQPALTASPAITTLNLATGGIVTVRLSLPQFLVGEGVACQGISPVPGVLLKGNPCPNGSVVVPLNGGPVGAGIATFALTSAALAATASSGPGRPRTTHIVFPVINGAVGGFGFIALRINRIEPARGPVLSEVRLAFLGSGGRQPFGLFKLGQPLPPIEALLRFQGGGLLRARWEVVQPGDPEPTELDLTPEPGLSLEARSRQHRWRLLQRVQTFVAPTGLTTLPGPNPRLLPNDRHGLYTVLLRIESSQPLAPGVDAPAPLLLPVLRYAIGDAAAATMRNTEAPQAITVIAPQGLVFSDRPLAFSWQERADATLYRIELERDGQLLYAARVRPDSPGGVARFTLPAFAQAPLGGAALRWRVLSVASDGAVVGESRWVEIQWAVVK